MQTRQNIENRLIYGSYPEVVLMNSNEQRREYLKNIVNSCLLKDILMADGIKNALDAFSRQLRKEITNLNNNLDKDVYFRRTYDEQEIDFIEVYSDDISAFEFKTTHRTCIFFTELFSCKISGYQ